MNWSAKTIRALGSLGAWLVLSKALAIVVSWGAEGAHLDNWGLYNCTYLVTAAAWIGSGLMCLYASPVLAFLVGAVGLGYVSVLPVESWDPQAVPVELLAASALWLLAARNSGSRWVAAVATCLFPATLAAVAMGHRLPDDPKFVAFSAACLGALPFLAWSYFGVRADPRVRAVTLAIAVPAGVIALWHGVLPDTVTGRIAPSLVALLVNVISASGAANVARVAWVEREHDEMPETRFKTRTAFIDWAVDRLETFFEERGHTFAEDGKEALREAYAKTSQTIADRPGIYERYQAELQDVMDAVGLMAVLGARRQRLDAIGREQIVVAIDHVQEVKSLTLLCDIIPGSLRKTA